MRVIAASLTGQLLPSRTGNSSADPQRALDDWSAGRLDARQLNGRFLLVLWDEAHRIVDGYAL